MAKKTFKVGEYAIGGIITVEITGKVIQIKALDYYNRSIVESSGSILCNENGAEYKIDNYLNYLTSSYHAEKILTWIKGAITFPF